MASRPFASVSVAMEVGGDQEELLQSQNQNHILVVLCPTLVPIGGAPSWLGVALRCHPTAVCSARGAYGFD
ncbi:hypothetical protein NHX12_022347 [Muraenolepis orangiensis]|uniref:Uncharacterized protein n=1 Tax=Muraenolepis orangiensis TaxID=630683 RepID=A0A9Q0EPP8_9TELE|nr:hypothetical protein NHX12_022347 [Muraenolepis orangiensis]